MQMLKSLLTKSILALSLIGCVFWITGCEEDPVTNDTDGIVVDDDYYEFQDFILGDYDIPAVISLPDETANIGASTRPEVVHAESFKWEINVGTNFKLLIEDFGSIEGLVKEEKARLEDQKKFFKIRYLMDEKDMILYERTLIVAATDDASSSVGVEHKTYHVYGQKKIDNVIYGLQSPQDGCEKVIIEFMAKSIKSFKERGKA